ncbi:transcriptional regulator, GntR family [Micromonospora pallida]|uniref:Transcriptional regulator, GntR family n=1 Tax=Micromonospora pallida TaxID=145854 RepID=A0A1C6SFP9_9ACTN|nr:GntR family transcriptional regulator [Micromonospora pallida]SCL28306.1 transcriptional regulator, GntR family [Micromonospora pallida]
MVTSHRPTRAPTLGDQLAEVIRNQIVRRTVQPGTHLIEDALASQYDVSRGPVRDALRQLESQGLVESRRRGYFVAGLSQRDIEDLYELREAIEVVAVTRAIDLATPQQLQAARDIVGEMAAAADRSSAAEFAKADLRFHALLYQMGGNRRIANVWKDYEPVFASLMQLTVEETDLHPSANDHGLLLDLIVAGDPGPLASGMREHVRGARKRMSHAMLEAGLIHSGRAERTSS